MSELINLYKDAAATQQVFPRTQIEAIEGLYELIRKARPVNLLDNSDFRNPVNQRGNDSYTLEGWGGYAIDRWTAYASGCTVTASNDGIQLNGDLYQPISKETARRYNGKTVTIAAKMGGNVYCAHGVVNQKGAYNVTARVDTPDGTLLLTCENTDMLFFILDTATSTVVEWAALYEGEYTAETLPEYQSKGYAVELLECQRYYKIFRAAESLYDITLTGCITNGSKDLLLTVPINNMYSIPTGQITGKLIIRGVNGYIEDSSNGIDVIVKKCGKNSIVFGKVDDSTFNTNATNNTPIQVNLPIGAQIEFIVNGL